MNIISLIHIDDIKTDDQALEKMNRDRWADGFECPRCQSQKGWVLSTRRLIQCANCDKQTSPTANTVYHGTRRPLLDLQLLVLLAQGCNDSARTLAWAMGYCYTTMFHHLHVARLVLKNMGAAQKAMIDCDRLKPALFKRSKEVKSSPPLLKSALFRDEAPQEVVLQTIEFILKVFTGVSRKFAQSYATQFELFKKRDPRWDMESLLRLAFIAKAHPRQELSTYRSPQAVLIDTHPFQTVPVC